ncbi:MAG: hypothetical protein ABJG47_11045 [Ekhidna sp.]
MKTLSSATIQFEITLQADVDSVWNNLVNQTTKWWSKDFYTNTKTKGFHIEGRIGGKAYEDFGDGEGLIWSEVIGVDAPNSIQMKGLLAPEFGGPAISYISINLKSNGSETVFKFSDTLFGALGEATADQIESGWKMIYGEAFKNYIESK